MQHVYCIDANVQFDRYLQQGNVLLSSVTHHQNKQYITTRTYNC